ncbi:uncharacterized protein M421DRAFT_50396 [Didymella exigua CBS 183.55]|uniref:Arb2 domain-containing protein n=1 Tax=Didymella exigua CBS 183.55 TaxID=1150837 RepID=A0A6A5S4N1_9PLEO|nr:uncharacterized protein M421DRAFT_50396 [Didymella exigua CBS 183.55]KAF1934308.1 hypothetical protein M421DRAFT_50396 [Didymella exigua CBS 183.55]
MFRRKEDTITPDASYPADLTKLGFFINRLGHIRMIEAPEKPFVFNSTNIERHNEVRNEALHACSRAEVLERLSKLGIKQLYFPHFTTTKPDGPHIPTLAPPLDILKRRKRIVVIINDTLQDLGILAYRQLQRELGLNGGSVVNFAKELVQRAGVAGEEQSQEATSGLFDDGASIEEVNEIPGLIVMNTGQLLYSHKYNKAMTMRSWYALPRRSIAHDHVRIHDQENHVEGHRNATEHIKSVFDQLLCDPSRVVPDAEVYIVAIEGGADKILELFKNDFEKYGRRVTAMAVVHTMIDNSEITHPSIKAFLHQRTRQWKYSDLSLSPTQCIELPDDYAGDASRGNPQQGTKAVCWNENLAEPGPLSKLAETLHHLTLNVVPSTNRIGSTTDDSASDDSSEWKSGSVPCPTFAGGKEPTGECIFTETNVQRAILSFFEDVAQDPENYRNPPFTTFADVPHPTADVPFVLSADAIMQPSANIQTAYHMLTPEQQELEEARTKLADMRIALDGCPDNIDILAKGRVKLAEKITKQEAAIKDLQVKALSSGSLGVGEAEEERQDWSTEADGPKVPFAGIMVDSELLKAAGLSETAREELEKLREEDKAFI